MIIKKEDLRTIAYNTTKSKTGYFHHWLKKKDEEGSEYTIAFIEKEDGTTKEMHPTNIQFTD